MTLCYCLGRQKGKGGGCSIAFCAHVLHFVQGSVRFSLHECLTLGTESIKKGLVPLIGDPSPPLCYHGVDTDILHIIKPTRPSPSVFAVLKVIKTGWWGRPGNEARVKPTSNFLASFPGSNAQEREHWSCTGMESLVFFVMWKVPKVERR